MSPENVNTVESVPLPLLRRYLAAHGWKVAESPGTPPPLLRIAASANEAEDRFFRERATGKRDIDVYVLSEAGLEDVELIVPRDRSGSDFERRLQGVIDTLSQIEDKRPQQIVSSIRSIGFDVVQSRIPDILVTDDTIQLEHARNYINGMKDLLAATATTELRPLPFFGRQSKDATDYSENCRFGHTYRGSFGFTIESPLLENTGNLLFDIEPAPPFSRRVIQRLATGIQHVCQSVDADDLSPLVQGFKNGLSANACDRFATLVHSTAYSGMSFGFAFSPEWRLPETLRNSVEFTVGPRHVEMARAAAQALRGEAVEVPAEVSGLVVRLQNEADPSDLSAIMGQGEISVLCSTEFGDIHVRITLVPAEYLKAVEAHRLGRSVRINGTLVHRGRYWYLNNPSTLSVIYQEELGLEVSS